MSLQADFDVVVVVGFGVVGATAALAAAKAEARVIVVEQDPLLARRRRGPRSTGTRDALRARLRRAALSAGVEVRTQRRVHELMVDGDRVCGLGVAALPGRGPAASGHRWARRLAESAPERMAPALDRLAEEVWRSAFCIEEVPCASVILAVDPAHWEFVGTAMWKAAGRGGSDGRRRRLAAVPDTVGSRRELDVRTWCALHEASPEEAALQRDLRVNEATGEVLDADDLPVPGLFSAVHAAEAAFEFDTAPRRASGIQWSSLGALARSCGVWERSMA
ncbi:hypothetical protein GCM10022221_26500 [Actinocorallia aurea]